MKFIEKIITFILTCIISVLAVQPVSGTAVKVYSQQDIKSLTKALEDNLSAGNERLSTLGYKATISPYYQVYKSTSSNSLIVVYTVELNKQTYTVFGEAPICYFTGLNTVINKQQELFETKNQDNIKTPTNSDILIIERGGAAGL